MEGRVRNVRGSMGWHKLGIRGSVLEGYSEGGSGVKREGMELDSFQEVGCGEITKCILG